MTPYQLDTIINGAKVYIYRRPSDGEVYADISDFSRFGVDALEIVRVRLTETSSVDDVLANATVKRAIKRHSKLES